jgi:hypothetical protein
MSSQFNPERDEQDASNMHNANKSFREAIPAPAGSIRRCDKTYYLDLIKRQSQQMRELGLLRSFGPEETARIDAALGNLNVDLLKEIARGAGNLLRGN